MTASCSLHIFLSFYLLASLPIRRDAAFGLLGCNPLGDPIFYEAPFSMLLHLHTGICILPPLFGHL